MPFHYMAIRIARSVLAAADFDARVEAFADKMAKWFKRTVPNPGYDAYVVSDFYVEPRQDKYLFIPAGHADKRTLAAYVPSTAKEFKLRVENLGGGRYALTDGLVVSKPLLLKAMMTKLRAAIMKEGFQPYKSWETLSVMGPQAQSSGNFTLDPDYDKKSYRLVCKWKGDYPKIQYVVHAQTPVLGLAVKDYGPYGWEIRLAD